jgi:hypothetical protein
MDEYLTPFQAYKVMFTFLEEYYNRKGKPDDLGILLGDTHLLDDQKPADPAMWNDWIMAIKRVIEAE